MNSCLRKWIIPIQNALQTIENIDDQERTKHRLVSSENKIDYESGVLYCDQASLSNM